MLGQPSMSLFGAVACLPTSFTSFNSEWFDRCRWTVREVTSLAQEVTVHGQHAVGVAQICPEAFAHINST